MQPIEKIANLWLLYHVTIQGCNSQNSFILFSITQSDKRHMKIQNNNDNGDNNNADNNSINNPKW